MMRLRLGVVWTLVVLLLPLSTAAQVADPSPVAPPHPVYVSPFGVALQPGGRGGLLGRRREDRGADKARAAAASLAEAIVRDFTASGYPARFLAPDAELPRAGWLLRGAWYALEANGAILSVPHFLGGAESPNVDLSVSVADLAVDPDAPFVVFGKAEALKGQETPVGWNPTVIAAKFVAHKAKAGAEIEAIAKEIVETILANRAALAGRAASAPTP